MSREEEALIHRYDAHTAPDIVVHTPEGLQPSLEWNPYASSNAMSESTPSLGGPQSSPPALESFSSMNLKRAQEAALPHYGDVHTAPDVLVQTRKGLQLLPGRAPSSQSASPRYNSNHTAQNGVTRVGGPVQFARTWHGTSATGESIPTIPKKSTKLIRRKKAQGPLPVRPLPVTAQDPVLLELQSLREEVRRLAAERERPDTPPHYEP
ncbi:hypothetical protein B0H19DRAFT_1167667 [Mycena capillaripes]|nr:hypothetical protein B0H19DRAFT_1167667 [Mycena capillaripes]